MKRKGLNFYACHLFLIVWCTPLLFTADVVGQVGEIRPGTAVPVTKEDHERGTRSAAPQTAENFNATTSNLREHISDLKIRIQELKEKIARHEAIITKESPESIYSLKEDLYRAKESLKYAKHVIDDYRKEIKHASAEIKRLQKEVDGDWSDLYDAGLSPHALKNNIRTLKEERETHQRALASERKIKNELETRIRRLEEEIATYGTEEKSRKEIARLKKELKLTKKELEVSQQELTRMKKNITVDKAQSRLVGRWSPQGNESVVEVRFNEKEDSFTGTLVLNKFRCYKDYDEVFKVVLIDKKDPNRFSGRKHFYNDNCKKQSSTLWITVKGDELLFLSRGKTETWYRVHDRP